MIVALGAGGLVLWKSRGRGESASGAKTGSGSSQIATATRPAAVVSVQPATAIVTVKGGTGPLAGATVRFAREGGDVITLDTGADGTATAATLDAGSWTISASASGHEPGAVDARELRTGETARIDITLSAGGSTLKGVVTDATGGPIAGARIDAAKIGTLAAPSSAVASTLTGATGEYSLSVSEGQLLVAASEPSYAPQSRYVDVGAAGAVASFALVPGGVIEGLVRDEQSREPVAGATVEARRDQPAMALGERALVRAVSGADGRFRVAGLRPGNYNLAAHAGPQMSRAPTTIGIGVAEQVSDVEILITKGPSIRGTVVDEAGAPVADAEVNLFGEGMRGRSVDARSDAKGAFAIEGMQPGNYRLMARTESHLPAGDVPVELENADVTGIKLTVRAGIVVKGHVEPRQVCEVSPDTEGDGPMTMLMLAGPTTTGADGGFELRRLEPTTYVLEARCPSGDQGSTKITAAPNAREVVISVKPGASIAGRVVDGAGKPVAGVKVMANPLGGTEKTTIVNGVITSGVQTLTNGQGAFELRGLRAGAYRLGALERGRPLPAKGDTKVTLAATEKKTGVTLTVDRPDGVIRGVVTGPDGKPLAEAWVSLHVGIEDMLAERNDHENGGSRMVRVEMRSDDESADATAIAPVLTNVNGEFQIGGLSRIHMTVVAEAQQGKLRGQAMGVVPDAQITIQALALTELRGTVKAPGKPPAWFTVELDGPTKEQRNFASGDGAFSFARVDPGMYKVSVTSPAGNGEATVKVVAGQPTTVEVVLAPNAIVIGKLVDAAGKPAGGLPVAVIPDAGDGHMRISLSGPPLTSGPDGTFRIEAKAGKSGLIVMTPPAPTTRMGLVLEAGKTLDVGTVTVAGPSP